MSAIDPDGLQEFSVVFTDRSLNHMSQRFQHTMRDIVSSLREVYNASGVAVVPGGGTYAMEAVARQFAVDVPCLVVRNGFFSFRWSQIIDAGRLNTQTTVCQARQVRDETVAPFAPAAVEDVVAEIRRLEPAVVFAPHVETASGILLPDAYVQSVGAAAREVGALFVLDCIASGCLWVNMEALNVDVLISAPQKGWSSSPCAGLVMLNDRAEARLAETQSSSFACDLGKWRDIVRAYEDGGHAYHATMPTDGLTRFAENMQDTRAFGFEQARQAQIELGARVRELLQQHGLQSVAAPGFEAPGVVVSFTGDAAIAGKFAAAGLQVAVGVPLQCGERADFQTFRIGLFGLDKLTDVRGTVDRLAQALAEVVA